MSVIKIKRSGSSGNPSVLRAGELAYSALSGNESNGGDRLYFGFGAETDGNALNHFVIGGKYFTDMLSHHKGTLVASSALVVDSDSKIDVINIGNITVTGSTNTVSSTDLDGNILLNPNGIGYVEIVGTNGLVIPTGDNNQRDETMPEGTIRYNNQLHAFEGWDGVIWTAFGGGGAGGAVRYDISTQALTTTQQSNARHNIGLDAGTGITYNTTDGTINIGQSVATSASVSFAGLTLTSAVTGTEYIARFKGKPSTGAQFAIGVGSDSTFGISNDVLTANGAGYADYKLNANTVHLNVPGHTDSLSIDASGNVKVPNNLYLLDNSYFYNGAWTAATAGSVKLYNHGQTNNVTVGDSSVTVGAGSYTWTFGTDGSTKLPGTLKDSSNSVGTEGQVLKSTATGIQWFTQTTDYVNEGSNNKYFTTQRARTSISGGTGISYSNNDGIINIDNTVVTKTDIQTLTNKTINGPDNTITNIANSSLSNSTISGVALGNNLNALTISTGLSGTSYNGSTGVTIAIDSTVVTLDGVQTLTNKTLTSPKISSISNTGTLTLPTSTDTLVGRATTDTLTNKTINGPDNTITNIANSSLSHSTISGVALGDNLYNLTISTGLTGTSYNGSGGVTIAIDSTVVTYSGSGTLTNKTFDTAATGNVLKINGTPVTDTTGTGKVALGTNPTISGATLSNHVTVEGVTSTGATGTGKFVFDTSPTVATPTVTTSLATSSDSFDLVNTTATNVNFAGAATTLNIGNSSGTTYIAGNLDVKGTVTTIESTTVSVADKNIELGKVLTPTNNTAAGGGITLRGTTDKTLNWVLSTTSWTSSENFDLASGKTYKINGTDVLSATALGSGVTGSSLTSVGTITTGVWNGTAIANSYLTNSTIVVNGVTLTLGDTNDTIKASTTNALTIGTGLTGTSFDGSTAVTIAIDSTVVTKDGTQTLTNKTLTSPVIGTIVNTGTLTLPTSTDTLVGRATTDTFTNKTFDTAGTGNVLKINGTQVTDTTGTGKVVLDTSPTISGATLSNHVTVEGVTSTGATGTGKFVFDTSPTLVTPTLGVATATSVNKVTITAPATGSTLTIADDKTLTVRNTLTFTGTDSSSVAFGGGGTVLYSASTLDASKLSGTIPDSVLGNSTIYIGTTNIQLNRTSGSLTLNGTSISGNAGTATTLQNIRNINGVGFNGSADITIKASTTNALTIGTGLTGTSFDGSSAVTIAIDSTVVTKDGTQTLTNKTLTSPIISTISNIGTLTLPTSTDTLVGRATTDTFTNKTFDTAATGNVLKINGTQVTNTTGTGKVVLNTSPTFVTDIKLSGYSSGTVTLAASSTASGTLLLPSASDTLVGKATTDTFTNKTYDTAGTGNVFKINGTQVSDVTGTGKVVLDTSPTVATPTVTTSLSTTSTSFDLVNTTATTVNFAGAATTVNLGNASGTVYISGNLEVKGTTTTIDSTTVSVVDKNIELGTVTTPTNTTADGGGITLHGTIDKTLNWVLSTLAWTSSENFDIANNKTYKINGTDVLSSTALGSGVTGSSLTSVGTITSGTWHGTAIANSYLANSTIVLNGVTLTLGDTNDTIKASTTNALTIGTGLSGTSFDGSTAVTIAIDNTVVTLSGSQTLTNKTLTSPIIGTIVNTGTLTLPTSTDTLVGRATTDTFTNKTFDTAGTGNVFKISGTAISAVTGTGSVVLATSPTLVTPTLGVASVTSVNKLTITTPATGSTLTIADGKTLTASNTLTFTGTDASSVAFGAGGTVLYTSSTLDASKLSGTIPSTVLGNSTVYIGTTAVYLNRATGSISLTGTSIDGNASTATTLQTARNIQGVSFNGSADITVVTAGTGISVSGTAVTNTGVTSITGTASQITASASTGAITLSLPQSIATTSSPTFATVTHGTSGVFNGSTSGAITVQAAATAGTNTLTLPAATDTLVGKATTDTLTNKTIAAGSNTISGLTNSNLSGTAGITNANLANSNVTVGTTAIALGASSTTLAGLTSVTSTSFVGALTGNASTVTNGVYTTDTGTVTNTMLAGSIADTKLSTISTAGKVSNSATTATSANTASAIVARDASGNFTAGTITAALSGNATTATTLQTARDINGVSFNGSQNVTVKASTTNALTIGTGLTGTSFDGSSATTIAVDTTTIATRSYVTGLNYITLTSLSTGTPNSASGSGSISYSNTTGVFTYTPPDLSSYVTLTSLSSTLGSYVTSSSLSTTLSSYVTSSTLSGYNYITLTSLSMDTPGTASGSGSVTYSNATGKFKYTPPDLSSYITASVATLSSLTSIGSTGVDTTAAGNLIVSGNLTVNGTIETINSTTTTFADKNIELAKPVSPATASDASANGGGITLHGTTDKTLNWLSSSNAWTSSENFDLASTKTYKINGTDVLSATALGSGVVNSSLTKVGTITTGVWNGTAIANSYLANSTIVVNGVTLTLGDTNDTIKASTTNALTIGTGLTGTSFDGSSATTVAVDTTTIATRDYVTGLGYITNSSLSITTNSAYNGGGLTYSNGVFTFTPVDLSGYLTTTGNAASANRLYTARLINGVPFDGTHDITITANATAFDISQLNAGSLVGIIPSTVLGNSTVYVGTTAVALNRASAPQDFTGIGSISFPEAYGGYIKLQSAGPSLNTINYVTVPATTGTIVTTGDNQTITNGMLANSSVTINGTSVSLGSSATVTAAAETLTSTTLNSSVTASSLTSVGILTGLTSSGAVVITNTTSSTNISTGALIVTGGVAVGGRVYANNMTVTNTIIGSVSGNSGSTSRLLNPVTINGTSFNGSANITFTTDATAEGSTNLYFTTARARASLSSGTGISYNSTTGAINSTITQYTNALARASLSSGVGINYISSTGVINTVQDIAATASPTFVAETLTGTTDSISTTTGTLTVAGGVGVAKNLNVGGNTSLNGTVAINANGNTWNFNNNNQLVLPAATDIITSNSNTVLGKSAFMYQDGNLTLKTGTLRWYAPGPLTIKTIICRLAATSDGTVEIKVKKSGTVVSTIDVVSPVSKTTAAVAINLAVDDYLTVDVTQIGSNVAPGAGLSIEFKYYLT